MYDDPEYLHQGYSQMSSMINKFKETWKRDYLTALREKHSTVSLNQIVPVSVGDIVLVETTGPRESWPLARVTQLLPDAHQQVRAVEVYSEGQTLVKTLNKLVNLEISPTNVKEVSNESEVVASGSGTRPGLTRSDDSQGTADATSHATPSTGDRPTRVRRKAAIRARNLFKDLGQQNLL